MSCGMTEENVSVRCACGKVHSFRAAHYDRIITDCGRPYCSLRPKKDGPLQLFPHPGANLTREEMGGQRSAEQIVRGMNK